MRTLIPALFLAVASTAVAAPGKPVLELYVMSLCPFGVMAENAVIPAIKSLDGATELKLYFIGNEAPGPDGKPVYTALHGQPEVDENIRQVCALKTQPKKALDYILERNKEYKKPDWKTAALAVGLDVKKIEDCFASEEGKRAYSESMKASRDRQASGSPTIYIDGELYKGARGVKSFTLALCKALEGKGLKQPAGCAKAAALPDDPAPAGGNCGPAGAPASGPSFALKVVTEKDCAFCQPTILDALKAKHPGAKAVIVDAASKEGKELIERHNADSLPLYVLDKKASEEKNFPELFAQFYARSADGFVVRPGMGTYVPVVRLARKRQPRHLDLFVESLSGRSAGAEAEVLRFLAAQAPDDVTFSLHFVVQEVLNLDAGAKETKLTSAQGEAEIQENLRQVCLFQRAGMKNFITYLDCRNQNLSDQRRAASCLSGSQVLDKCMKEGEGMNLLRQDARLARELRLQTGPAILWENKYGPFALHEADWKGMIKEKK